MQYTETFATTSNGRTFSGNYSSGLHYFKKNWGYFCETRWMEKHTTHNDFNIMYVPFTECLEAICLTWFDGKAVIEAHGI